MLILGLWADRDLELNLYVGLKNPEISIKFYVSAHRPDITIVNRYFARLLPKEAIGTTKNIINLEPYNFLKYPKH